MHVIRSVETVYAYGRVLWAHRGFGRTNAGGHWSMKRIGGEWLPVEWNEVPRQLVKRLG